MQTTLQPSINYQRVINRALGKPVEGVHAPKLELSEFKQRLWPAYRHTPFQALLDAKLTAVANYLTTGKGTNRLIVEMPPRHGKTESVSRYFPAWLFGQYPEMRLILTSYTAELAYENSRRVRNLIQQDGYHKVFPHVHLAPDQATVKHWELANGRGGCIAAGVGGGVTGHGANLILIDDPIKSRAEAQSETWRKRLIDWYKNDLRTRLQNPGAIILINTRWHMADLAGWLEENSPYEWDRLTLPALAKSNDPLGRPEGAALWPEEFNAEFLLQARAEMGEYEFESLYQQAPMPSGGGLFDTAQITVLDTAPECKEIIRFYDLAVTTKTRSSYTVGLKLGITKDETVVVLDVLRVQRELPDVHKLIIQTAQSDGRGVRIRLEAEKAGIVELQALLREPALRGYRMDAEAPKGDKYTRAMPVSVRVNAGRVVMVKGDWNRAFVDELSLFPHGQYADQVDGFSGGYEALSGKRKAGGMY